MGSWVTWNSQTPPLPDTSPGKHGYGKGSDTCSMEVTKEALVRWHSGEKISQELVGLRQLLGEREKRAELEGCARKARTEKWDWRL